MEITVVSRLLTCPHNDLFESFMLACCLLYVSFQARLLHVYYLSPLIVRAPPDRRSELQAPCFSELTDTHTNKVLEHAQTAG
jgi:hypothetical protein